MVQGTASHVGKSVMVSALCRILRQDGFRVAPFKAQNMSNNSYVTADGGEIGRAQAAQAQAAGVEPKVEMNPVLLKPEADHTSQVVLMGRPQGSTGAREYFDRIKPRLWQAVRKSLNSLREDFDVVVIEGAGSPAEINLKAAEIVNMAVARYANAPVLLCGDIDRGGVFASLVGTMELLEPDERALVRGFIINKFRGDLSLLTDGLTWLEQRTGVPVAGVVPYFRDIHIPEEDSVPLEYAAPASKESLLDIAVVYLPHISNFDDFDPLARENGVSLRYVASPGQLGRPDLVILPGTKTTIPDFCWMEERSIPQAVQEAHRNGSAIIGICGGYQMLGTGISDPHNVESSRSECKGLGLLPSSTVFAPSKETHRILGHVCCRLRAFCPGPGDCRSRGTRFTWAGLTAREPTRPSASKTGRTSPWTRQPASTGPWTPPAGCWALTYTACSTTPGCAGRCCTRWLAARACASRWQQMTWPGTGSTTSWPTGLGAAWIWTWCTRSRD